MGPTVAVEAVGPYEVLEKLGSGGMGEVFLCRDTRLHRQVALKALTSGAAGDDLRERVLREARAAARLNHPHIATIYDVVEEGDRAYIVMEYVEGRSLAAEISRGPMPIERVIAIGRQLAGALATAHAHGVVHRDLKPANIQLTSSGSAKVLDFGVARTGSPVSSPMATTIAVPSAAATTCEWAGTPLYMAPEQLLGRFADARSDIYSLGVVLFEMATGRRPYLEGDAIGLAVAMAKAPPPAAQAIDPAVPRALSDVIGKALAPDAGERYQSAAELESALAGIGEPRSVSRRAMTLALAASLLLAAGLAARVLLPKRGPSGAGSTPVVLAILPVDNPTGDPQAGYLGAGFASLAADNLGSIAGVKRLSLAATAPYENKRKDVAALHRELGATHVLDLSILRAAPTTRLVARMTRSGSISPVWERVFEGDPIEVEKALLEGVADTLEYGLGRSGFTAAERARVRRLDTKSGAALLAHARARALVDRYDLPANIDRAIEQLTQAVAVDPDFAAAQAALGDAYWEKYQSTRDPALAAKGTDAVMRAVGMAPEHAAVFYSLGNMQHLTGRPDEAVESLRRALGLQPDNDEAHRLLGQVLADRGDVDGGIAELERAIRIRPQYWRHYNALGLVHYRAGRYREALEPYRRASGLQPSAAGPFQMLGNIHYQLGDIDEAIGNYEHAVRLGTNAAAYANLALAYYRRMRYAEALKAYQQALDVNPKSAGNLRNIGDVYIRLNQPAKASAAYEQAIAVGNEILAVNARDYRTIALIALCEAKLGRASSAERHAAEARTLAPTDRETLQRGAEVHARLGQAAAALRDLESAIARGYSRREARENEELAVLRKLPAFAALVADRQ